MFFHLVGSSGHIVHSGASGVRNVVAIFFMLVWARYDFNKKRAGAHFVEIVFLHLVRAAGHVVHYGASGARNVDVLYFMLGCA
jgi:hypothetical protein